MDEGLAAGAVIAAGAGAVGWTGAGTGLTGAVAGTAGLAAGAGAIVGAVGGRSGSAAGLGVRTWTGGGGCAAGADTEAGLGVVGRDAVGLLVEPIWRAGAAVPDGAAADSLAGLPVRVRSATKAA